MYRNVPRGPARIATLGDLSNDSHKPDSQNNLYAGGKQRFAVSGYLKYITNASDSGIQLQGKPEDQNRGIVDKIFQKFVS